ncbi:hypothetical protein C8Q70DRAFT_944897 [Cubamyces menziesii]|nr:hypothetical protein C8Q70DRAFT_944897 [Cubamyces menziesii]
MCLPATRRVQLCDRTRIRNQPLTWMTLLPTPLARVWATWCLEEAACTSQADLLSRRQYVWLTLRAHLALASLNIAFEMFLHC